jgi:hypothetical protein
MQEAQKKDEMLTRLTLPLAPLTNGFSSVLASFFYHLGTRAFGM